MEPFVTQLRIGLVGMFAVSLFCLCMFWPLPADVDQFWMEDAGLRQFFLALFFSPAFFVVWSGILGGILYQRLEMGRYVVWRYILIAAYQIIGVGLFLYVVPYGWDWELRNVGYGAVFGWMVFWMMVYVGGVDRKAVCGEVGSCE
ncbi:hypothetical protein [Brevibacillus dissolubilis]|uniref:hypothetical protein n=1 Tax=Brevibacillus dissolubilis TaxID=1844116 RepID=UPI001115AF2F|nr:hypothetical protein [Brevibacillus dissolubilis]